MYHCIASSKIITQIARRRCHRISTPKATSHVLHWIGTAKTMVQKRPKSAETRDRCVWTRPCWTKGRAGSIFDARNPVIPHHAQNRATLLGRPTCVRGRPCMALHNLRAAGRLARATRTALPRSCVGRQAPNDGRGLRVAQSREKDRKKQGPSSANPGSGGMMQCGYSRVKASRSHSNSLYLHKRRQNRHRQQHRSGGTGRGRGRSESEISRHFQDNAFFF